MKKDLRDKELESVNTEEKTDDILKKDLPFRVHLHVNCY